MAWVGNQILIPHFILLGLFTHSLLHLFLFSIIMVMFLVALSGKGLMIFLINVDSRLHSPMYFFLSWLSLMDLMLISTIVPQMAVDFLLGGGSISFIGCGLQILFSLTLLGDECFLLAFMAYDRYVAISNPLRYSVFMSRCVCWIMVAGSWLFGLVDGLIQAVFTLCFPYCSSQEIDHFFCEVPAVLKLACADTSLYETMIYVCCVLMLLLPFSVISASYLWILLAVLRMRSTEGRQKAFATCSSHMVVSLFYGAVMITYMRPQAYHSSKQDKAVSAFYTMITPISYSLRNKEVTGALRKLPGTCPCGGEQGQENGSRSVTDSTSSPGDLAIADAGPGPIVEQGLRRVTTMELWNHTTVTNFILSGLFSHAPYDFFLFSLVLLASMASLASNIFFLLLIQASVHLYIPMYFFLSQFSITDLTMMSTVVPKMAANFLSGSKIISQGDCGAQIFLVVMVGGAECFLLAVMAYDRYVAICHPLWYPVLMNWKVCSLMTMASSMGGVADGVIDVSMVFSFPYCSSQEVDHFFCEVPALLHISCADTSLFEDLIYACCVVMLLLSLGIIVASYVWVLTAVIRMPSTEGKQKAVSTCSSHLAVVGLYYGGVIFSYMQRASSRTLTGDRGTSIFYTILTPLLNPLIYSLRNKEVMRALKKMLGRRGV
ncbi:LOW QUALITY PROTEIN: uncharacterized protein ACIGJ3_013977 [Trichechus inunguis]